MPPDYLIVLYLQFCSLSCLMPRFVTLATRGKNSPGDMTFLTRQVKIRWQMQKSSALSFKPTPVSPVSSRTVGPPALQYQLSGLCYHVREQFSMGGPRCWRPSHRRIWLTEGRTAGRGTWASLLGRSSASYHPFHHCSPGDQNVAARFL